MIAIDTSAIIAILMQEADARTLSECIERDERPVMSVASILECSIVMRAAKGLSATVAERRLDQLLTENGLEAHPVTLDHLHLARAAHIAYGKGTGHGAGLNFGDCFSYALAKALGVPLLYKGEDFAKTDVMSALA